MNELLQRIYDWYITSPRQSYRRYIEDYFKRRNLRMVTGLHDFLEHMNPLPLGYCREDKDELEAMHRRALRVIARLKKEDPSIENLVNSI